MKVIEPNANMVLVELTNNAHGAAKQLVIPEGAKDPEFATWIVRAVGPGRTLNDGTKHPTGFEVGDQIIFQREDAILLVPPRQFDDRKLALVDAAVVLCKVTVLPEAGRKAKQLN
jgi:co-chaperonin GroES (HSP10)